MGLFFWWFEKLCRAVGGSAMGLNFGGSKLDFRAIAQAFDVFCLVAFCVFRLQLLLGCVFG
jgi:hypothetical protein